MQKYVKKGKKEYAMIQIPAEAHRILKEYCDENGYAISKLLSIMIKNQTKK